MAFDFAVLAAFGAMVCWAFGDFFIQKSTRKVGNVESLAAIGLVGAVALLPFVWSDLQLAFAAPNLLLLVALGFVTFVAAILDFEALRQGKLSVVETIFEFELPVTVFLGIVFFGENLSALQLGIVSVIFAGILLISFSSLSAAGLGKRLEKGVVLALAGAAGMAGVNFLTASASKQVSPLLAIWFPWVVFLLFSLAVILRKESVAGLAKRAARHKRLLLAMGVFDTLAWLFYAFALRENYLSLTTAITESYVALGIVLGVWVNKEKISPHQLLGAGLALAGSVALGLVA